MRVEIGGNAVADGDEALDIGFTQAVDLAQAETQREGCFSKAHIIFVMPAQAGIQ
jgi:hypothetical protein